MSGCNDGSNRTQHCVHNMYDTNLKLIAMKKGNLKRGSG